MIDGPLLVTAYDPSWGPLVVVAALARHPYLPQPPRRLTLGRSPRRSVSVASPASEAVQDNRSAGLPAQPAICVGPSWPNNSIKPNPLRESAYFQR